MKRWQRFLKKLEQALLSSTVTIHQCLPCVQERVRVLHRTKFSLWIWHFAWFEAFYIVSSFRFKGENYPRLARSHSLTHPLPLHKSKPTREHLRTGDMAGLGKSKERYTRNLLEREWQVGKVSVLERRSVSALLVMSEISNELPCRGNMVHASMYNAGTCAYPHPWRAEHYFLTGVWETLMN